MLDLSPSRPQLGAASRPAHRDAWCRYIACGLDLRGPIGCLLLRACMFSEIWGGHLRSQGFRIYEIHLPADSLSPSRILPLVSCHWDFAGIESYGSHDHGIRSRLCAQAWGMCLV